MNNEELRVMRNFNEEGKYLRRAEKFSISRTLVTPFLHNLALILRTMQACVEKRILNEKNGFKILNLNFAQYKCEIKGFFSKLS